MSYKWDDKLIEKFLTLYRKHQCLWNPYSPNYKNCSVKNEAFRIVIQELNIPKIKISECLQQIEVIREKYKEEQLKAERELKSGKLYTSKLPWFNLMSQMLCEVINDEENFSDVQVRIIPRNATRGEQNDNPRTVIANKNSSNLLYKPEKYVESKSTQNNSKNYFTSKEELEYRSKKLTDEKSRHNNLQHGSKVVNDANEPWNICPSCGWETEIKNKEKTYDGTSQYNNYEESTARINPEIEMPLRIRQTKIFDTSNKIGEPNQLKPPRLCVDERNHFNWKTKTPETEIMQSRKKVQMNAGLEPTQDSRGKLYVSMQQNKCNVIEDEVTHQDMSKAKNSLDVMSAKKNNVHYPRNNNEFGKSVIMCPNHMTDIQSQFLENQLRNFEINQSNHCIDELRPNLVLYQDKIGCQSQKISEFEDETEHGYENLSTKRYNSCIPEFGEGNTKSSEEDEYEVCSRFKIIIPSSDQEDQNLEITGYEVRVINPQLSKYMLCSSSDVQKLAIGNVECTCKNEFSVPNRNVSKDSGRYGNIIKLNINHKRSKESRAKKRLHKSAATSTRQETDPENDQDSEIDGQHKSFSNKKTQTDCSCGNESIQTSKNIETSKFISSKSVKDQGSAIDAPSMHGTPYRATTLDRNDNLIRQHQTTLQDHSIVNRNTTVPAQIENSLLPVDRFNNTRIFLNVIVKILQSDDSNAVSEDLQTTLDTMLDRIEHMSMIGQSATQYDADINTQIATFNDTMMSETMSTQYGSLPSNLAPANRQAKNINSQKSSNKTLELSDRTIDFRPQTVELNDKSADFRPPSLILGEPDIAVNKEAGGNERKSWPSNATNKSINERSTRIEPPTSLLGNTNTSANSTLDYTSDFLNQEPIASSSRKFREHRTPSQLAKDFLDVMKFTMLMDGVSQSTENGNKDCCTKKKHPN